MEIYVHCLCDYGAVYLINGSFSERGELKIQDKDILYITILPLTAALLPYTVKLLGAKVLCNNDLVSVYTLSPRQYTIKFKERYNYVYTPKKGYENEPEAIGIQFFKFIKQNRLTEARKLLTKDLNETIDNASLTSFFDEYNDIIVDKSSHDSYFLIDNQGKGANYRFILKNNQIDDISETDIS